MQNYTIDTIGRIDLKIKQPKKGYRFAIESLLLADFVNIPKKPNNIKILDLACGCGVIGLILAYRYANVHITGLELQERLSSYANDNIKLNNFDRKMQIIRGDLRIANNFLKENSYDIIISNPPYYPITQKNISPILEKQLAKSELKCNLEDIIKVSAYLLKNKGRLAIVHLPIRLAELLSLLRKYNLEPKRLQIVYPNTSQEANYILVEARLGAKSGMKIDMPFILYNEEGIKTEEAKRLENF